MHPRGLDHDTDTDLRDHRGRVDGHGTHHRHRGHGEVHGEGRGNGPGNGPDDHAADGSGPRPLRRSRTQRKIAGVAGGFAETFGIDPVIPRIAIVVLTLTTGLPLILYPLAWWLMPKAEPGDVPRPVRVRPRGSITAVVLISIGIVMFFDRIGVRADSEWVWPLALIGIGAAVLWSRSVSQTAHGPAASSANAPMSGTVAFAGTGFAPHRRVSASPASPTSPAPDTAVPRPYAATTGGGPEERGRDVDDPFGPLVDHHVVERSYQRPRPGPDPMPTAPTPLVAAARRFAHHGRRLFVLSTLAAYAAALSIGRRPALRDVFAYALLWLGTLLVIGAFLGRPKLLVLGFILSGALVVASLATIEAPGGIGERTFAPTQLASGEGYRLGIGSLTIDLRSLGFTEHTTVTGRVGVGELIVIVPDDVNVHVTSEMKLGESTMFGRTYDQMNGAPNNRPRSVRSDVGAKRTLDLDLFVGFGEITVRRAAAAVAGKAGGPGSVPSPPAPPLAAIGDRTEDHVRSLGGRAA